MAMLLDRARTSVMFAPLNSRMMSPSCNWAVAAGPVRHHTQHDRAVRRGGQAEPVFQLGRGLLEPGANPGRPDPAVLPQLVGDELQHVRWNREVQPNRSAIRARCNDDTVHADHVAAGIDQRTTRITMIDRRVSLDVLVERTFHDVAVQAADDACRDRIIEPGRITDGDDDVSDLQLVAVAKSDRWHRRHTKYLEQAASVRRASPTTPPSIVITVTERNGNVSGSTSMTC